MKGDSLDRFFLQLVVALFEFEAATAGTRIVSTHALRIGAGWPRKFAGAGLDRGNVLNHFGRRSQFRR